VGFVLKLGPMNGHRFGVRGFPPFARKMAKGWGTEHFWMLMANSGEAAGASKKRDFAGSWCECDSSSTDAVCGVSGSHPDGRASKVNQSGRRRGVDEVSVKWLQ
jgi:hypothetical protein